MALTPVEWVLVIHYGSSAHRATYGRLGGSLYTKDYIQLSRKTDFLKALNNVFPPPSVGAGSVPLTYKWATGSTKGALVFLSADRPHLKWETILGAPQVWKMSLTPSEATAETIIGNPSFTNAADADKEFSLISKRGGGQPYLVAVKLRGEENVLHLRAYLKNADAKFLWADLNLVPKVISSLAAKTSQSSALAWSTFTSDGVALDGDIKTTLQQLTQANDKMSFIQELNLNSASLLAAYLRKPGTGLFFDPARNHDAWFVAEPISQWGAAGVDELLQMLDLRANSSSQGDAAAEEMEVSEEEVDQYRGQIVEKNYEVPDSHSTVKTRGSAQRVFADSVKANYGFTCAVTGLTSREFLVASHIVPWSEDQTIRLDPANGICLSLLVDRAFEKGYILIQDDYTLFVDEQKVGADSVLKSYLKIYHGKPLKTPSKGHPKVEYLQRRRKLVIG